MTLLVDPAAYIAGDFPGWATVFSFAAAILVLEFFDISLPRGDSLGVSGALNSAALALLGPIPAVVAACVGTLGAFGVRRRAERTSRPLLELFSMLLALCAAAMIQWLIAPVVEPSGWSMYASAALMAAVYLMTELAVIQLVVSRRSSRSAVGLLRGNLTRQTPLLLAQLSACVLTVVIYEWMGNWGLVPVVVLLLLIRQSYALLLDIRDTYRTTVEVLVEAAEGLDAGHRGHADRTAKISREIGSRCGMNPNDIERVSYAALLHDIGEIGAEGGDAHSRRSSGVLEGIPTFADVVSILKVLEGDAPHSESDALSAFVIGLASDIESGAGGAGANKRSSVSSVSHLVPSHVKARVVAAAVQLGYSIPAVS